MIPDLTSAEVARFYAKLRPAGGGVRWAGGDLNNKGYGRFPIYRDGQRVRILAHRLAYKLATGEDPGDAVIRHECDTPLCCTPTCLITGTQADNIHDMLARGRMNTTGLDAFRVDRDVKVQERIASGSKRCGDCKSAKRLDEFHVNTGNADGRQYVCKDCMADRQRSRRAARKAA